MTREKLVIRQWQMLDAMSHGPKTHADLAHQFKCSTKTIRRDLTAMIHVGLPVVQKGQYFTSTFSLQGDSMRKKLLHCKTCNKDITHTGAHTRYGHEIVDSAPAAPPKAKAETNGHFTRAELFSIIRGDVHLRGCEFNGGFLVLNGDTLQAYPSLAEALADAAEAIPVPSRLPELVG